MSTRSVIPVPQGHEVHECQGLDRKDKVYTVDLHHLMRTGEVTLRRVNEVMTQGRNIHRDDPHAPRPHTVIVDMASGIARCRGFSKKDGRCMGYDGDAIVDGLVMVFQCPLGVRHDPAAAALDLIATHQQSLD